MNDSFSLAEDEDIEQSPKQIIKPEKKMPYTQQYHQLIGDSPEDKHKAQLLKFQKMKTLTLRNVNKTIITSSLDSKRSDQVKDQKRKSYKYQQNVKGNTSLLLSFQNSDNIKNSPNKQPQPSKFKVQYQSNKKKKSSKQVVTNIKKVNFSEDKNVVRLINNKGNHIDLNYQTDDLKEKIQSLRHYVPDFGYQEQMEFGNNTNKGWRFFLDLISMYRQREKISNAINSMKKEKVQSKQEEAAALQTQIQPSPNKKGGQVNNIPIQLKNTPNENWLLWNFSQGKEAKKTSHLEIKIQKIKEDVKILQQYADQTGQWLEHYKKSISPTKKEQSINFNPREVRKVQSQANSPKSILNLKKVSFMDRYDEQQQMRRSYNNSSMLKKDIVQGDNGGNKKLKQMSWFINKAQMQQQQSINKGHNQKQQVLNLLFNIYKNLDKTSTSISLNTKSKSFFDEENLNSLEKMLLIREMINSISKSEYHKLDYSMIAVFAKDDFYQDLKDGIDSFINDNHSTYQIQRKSISIQGIESYYPNSQIKSAMNQTPSEYYNSSNIFSQRKSKRLNQTYYRSLDCSPTNNILRVQHTPQNIVKVQNLKQDQHKYTKQLLPINKFENTILAMSSRLSSNQDSQRKIMNERLSIGQQQVMTPNIQRYQDLNQTKDRLVDIYSKDKQYNRYTNQLIQNNRIRSLRQSVDYSNHGYEYDLMQENNQKKQQIIRVKKQFLF